MNSIVGLWRGFEVRAEKIERQWPFDRQSHRVYMAIVLWLIVEVAAAALAGFKFSEVALLGILGLMFLCLLGLLCRTYGHPRFALALEAFAIPPVIGCLAVGANILGSALPIPFQDHLLAAADRVLGFSFPAFYHLHEQHPLMTEGLYYAYLSFLYQVPAISLATAIFCGRKRFWRFLSAWTIALGATCILYPFFTAHGPYATYGISGAGLGIEELKGPRFFGAVIEAVRSGHLRAINWEMAGLVSFPSFHAAAAILLTWAIWPLRWVRWPVAALNAAMFISSIVIGAHYFIDLVGGLTVALMAIWSVRNGIFLADHNACVAASPNSSADVIQPGTNLNL